MADGVKLASGYIELTVKKAGDAMKEITAEITGVGKQAEKVGQQVGDALDKGISKGATKAGKTIHDAITEGAEKAGEEAGKKAGDAIEKGVREGATKAGETVREAINKGAKQAGDDVSKTPIEPKVDTKRARDAFKEFGKEVVVMVDKAANDAGITLEGVITGVAKEAGRKVGEELHDAIQNVPYLGDAARNIENWINPAVDGFKGLNDAVAAFKDKDAAGALNGLADALNAVGQTQAGGAVKDIADKAAPLQEKISSLKDDIKGTTDGFLALAGNSGRISGALAAIGEAAAPVAAALATLDTVMPGWHGAATGVLDQVQGKKGFNAKDWFNTLIPGTNLMDRAAAPFMGGADPTKGAQSPIPAKPGVSVIPLPGSAPAVEPGYTAVPGSGDPFAALAPQSKPSAAPSGLTSGGGGLDAWIDQALALTGTDASWKPGLKTLIGRESSGNPNAINLSDSNAAAGHPSQGLMQTIPGTFNAYHVPGTSNSITDPVANIAAGIGYIKSQYGHISNVQQANPNLPPKGYDDGGVLPPGMQLINNASGQPEIVLTQDQAKNAMQGMPGMGAGPSDTPLGSGESPGPNGAAALSSLMGGQAPDDSAGLAAMGAPGGKDQRTQGYIPAGAGGGGQAGTSLWSGAMQMGAQAINGLIDQAASAAATAISAAATAGSFGAGGQAAGPASSFLIGIGANMAKRGVQYGFQLAGIGGDALAEILMPFGVPRFFQTDPSQFMPKLPNMAAAVTTGEKAQQTQDNPQGAQQAGI
ncbi:transglycosylase SLT domain-containing protein, partial [Mycobacterium sp. 1245801.1]|uniref:lytic transglycosylase domain-containing protein n=1 Tax=Mycobacterium sp. 1245801.1 TaxID=1834075 RepID=UPI000A8DEE38